MAQSTAKKNHDSKISKNKPKHTSPHTTTPTTAPPKDIFSSKKHSLDYVTVDGIVLRTGHADKKYWYLLCIKELLDNAIDFLWKNYQGASDAAITVHITKTNDSMLHIKARNTNSKNIPVFENLAAIFDYDMRYGSKQNQHIISRRMLGDAMKQILSWSYVLIHTKDDGNSFTNKQWTQPLIIRNNGIERQIFLHVDKANQAINVEIKQEPIELPFTDTEIELTWPINDDDNVNLDIHTVEAFCRQYPILTTDISFKFRLVDNIKHQSNTENIVINNNDTEKQNLASELVTALKSPAPKATIKIDFPALHPIATGWSNISNISSYKPEEFVSSITSVYDKQITLLYDALRTFREGNSIKKSADNQISITELMLDPNKDKKVEAVYHELRNALDPPKKISLPYANDSERKQALIYRVMQLYPGQLDGKKAVYKVVHGFYNDDDWKKVWSKMESCGEIHDSYDEVKGSGILHYPFAFEIMAIPYNDSALKGDINQSCKILGFVNYSISPKSNNFEGDYEWLDKNGDYRIHANDVPGILTEYGFKFYSHSDAKTKLPCVIVANLISPRIDYHGHDKSRIDTQPFSTAIIDAARKVAEGIQTFKAAGYTFASHRDYYSHEEKKLSAKQALTEFLKQRQNEVGL